MRALGPGSVSSFLKVILDVTFFALWVAAVMILGVAALVLVIASSPDLARLTPPMSNAAPYLANPAATILGLSVAALSTVGVTLMVARLRSIFAALTIGDPFHPDNVRRLREIGIILGALEIGRYAMAAVSAVVHLDLWGSREFNPVVWFGVLVIFVLAEVFREGARLRREAELTI